MTIRLVIQHLIDAFKADEALFATYRTRAFRSRSTRFAGVRIMEWLLTTLDRRPRA